MNTDHCDTVNRCDDTKKYIIVYAGGGKATDTIDNAAARCREDGITATVLEEVEYGHEDEVELVAKIDKFGNIDFR